MGGGGPGPGPGSLTPSSGNELTVHMGAGGVAMAEGLWLRKLQPAPPGAGKVERLQDVAFVL